MIRFLCVDSNGPGSVSMAINYVLNKAVTLMDDFRIAVLETFVSDVLDS